MTYTQNHCPMKINYLALLCFFPFLSVHGQWTQVTGLPSGNRWKMGFFTQTVGYMNTNGSLLKTTDGGTTWTPTSVQGSVDGNFSFPSSNVGYLAGYYDLIKKTTDQGVTWTNIPMGNQSLPVYGVSFPDLNTGFTIGSLGLVRKTNDGGATWTATTLAGLPDMRKIHFLDADRGFVMGPNGLLRKTVNGGATWQTLTMAAGSILFDWFFLNSNIGFIVGDGGKIWKTTNSGATWTLLNSGTTEALTSVCFRNEQEGYVGGINGFMMKTLDGGATWAIEDNPYFLLTQKINDIVFTNNHYIAIGDGGHVTISEEVNSVTTLGKEPNGIEVAPNPASHTVAVRLSDQRAYPCVMRVYNSLGALVRMVELAPGDNQLLVADLSEGLYVLETGTGPQARRQKLMVRHE